MFIRQKKVGPHVYLQLVENRWEGGKTRQRIVASLGRLDRLRESGQLEVLLRSLGRCAEGVEVQNAQARGELSARAVRSVGPALVVGRVWRDLGIDQVLGELLEGRKYAFDVERAVFASVLHRLFESGSDRQAVRFLRDVPVPGVEDLKLHHLSPGDAVPGGREGPDRGGPVRQEPRSVHGP